jgi:AcrR family transcriptional regulator
VSTSLPDVRGRILAAATRRFVTAGYHGISMREIADDVGVSKAALYYHFRDKEALFLAILDESVGRMGALLDECAEAPTTREQLRHLLRGLFAWCPEERAVIRLASQEIVHLDEAARTAFLHRYHDAFVGRIRAFIRQGVERGELRPVDPVRTTWVLLGMIYPFILAARTTEDQQGPDELVLSIFFDGIGA